MRTARAAWASALVLVAAAALFVPVAALPPVAVLALLGRRLTRAALLRRDGRTSPAALLPPVLLVLLVTASAVAWSSAAAGQADWNSCHATEPCLTPNPTPARPDALLLTPLEHLVSWDPWFAGVALPALLAGVPVALAIVLVRALAR